MQINQQRCAPSITNPLKRAGQRAVIGLMNCRNALVQLAVIQPPLPQLAKPWQPARYKTKAAASPPAKATWRRRGISGRPTDHLPVHVIAGPVQIQHGPGRMGYQQSCAGFPCQRLAQQIGITIFQPWRGKRRMPHPVQQRFGIGPPGMWNGDDYWDRRWIGQFQRKCRRIRVARDRSTMDRSRISALLTRILHGKTVQPICRQVKILSDSKLFTRSFSPPLCSIQLAGMARLLTSSAYGGRSAPDAPRPRMMLQKKTGWP